MTLDKGLYIFWFLHQTTTSRNHGVKLRRCISFDSYIKPQLWCFYLQTLPVVYLLIPTSNHNYAGKGIGFGKLYIFWFLHQTTTLRFLVSFFVRLYIFWFLHQTTTAKVVKHTNNSCISFDSYIKPQHAEVVVTLGIGCISFDSYIKPQLSSLITSTLLSCISFDSYIKPQLKQNFVYLTLCCISFDSYIKPQPFDEDNDNNTVVYLLIPTSNHNCHCCLSQQ